MPRRSATRQFIIASAIGASAVGAIIAGIRYQTVFNDLSGFCILCTLILTLIAWLQNLRGRQTGKHAPSEQYEVASHADDPAGLGDPAETRAQAFYEIGRQYASIGDTAKALEAYEGAARLGHREAAYEFAKMCPRPEVARAYLLFVAKLGHRPAYELLVQLCSERSQIDDLLRLALDFAVDAGVSKLPAPESSVLLRDLEADLRRRAASGDATDMNDLGVLLAATGRQEEARSWFKLAEKHGSQAAADNLARTPPSRRRARGSDADRRRPGDQAAS